MQENRWRMGEVLVFADTSVSSLLLSEMGAGFYRRLLRRSHDSRDLFCRLIRKHRERLVVHLSSVRQKRNLRITYQSHLENAESYYVKVNFRPGHEDWAEIGLIAGNFRVSRTLIVSLMIFWEMEGEGKKSVCVPTFQSKPKEIIVIYRLKPFRLTRSFHLRP
ncbi:DUF1564 family protein [Leptospira kobayashii]|uniref:DUF1564 family protein n=1 Tax=Leptospira kobayashii TaxID=1917830 RepID=UPI000D59C4DC|nr:DUF1564 family protein [Leptospira kobayashii]